MEFYPTHVKSGALASFLVRPTRKTKGVIWADKYTGQIYSFLKKPVGISRIKAYDFSGLALFSCSIFKEITPGSFHIFKDSLEKPNLLPHLQVQTIFHLKLLDMNQLSSYLKSTEQALCSLSTSSAQNERESVSGCFLKKVLKQYSPDWCRFQGDHYFSATPVKRTPFFEESKNKSDILFCGRNVKGLEKLSVQRFAVLGESSSLLSPLCMERAVLRESKDLNRSLKNSLLL